MARRLAVLLWMAELSIYHPWFPNYTELEESYHGLGYSIDGAFAIKLRVQLLSAGSAHAFLQGLETLRLWIPHHNSNARIIAE